jgi:hypothetical protein
MDSLNADLERIAPAPKAISYEITGGDE